MLIAAAIAAAALQAYTSAEQADAQSAVAATAVQHCKMVAANSHRRGSVRVLSSVKLSKAQRYCAEARPHITTLRFWYGKKHRWMLYLNQAGKKCWKLKLKGPESLCLLARASVRAHARKLVKLDDKIKALLPQPKLVHDWLYDVLVCIHGGEGAWDANTGNGYYGGLQMDLGFQKLYGAEFMSRWGTADHWPPWAQIAAAERAYHSGRGFGPWPNTGPPCMSQPT